MDLPLERVVPDGAATHGGGQRRHESEWPEGRHEHAQGGYAEDGHDRQRQGYLDPLEMSFAHVWILTYHF